MQMGVQNVQPIQKIVNNAAKVITYSCKNVILAVQLIQTVHLAIMINLKIKQFVLIAQTVIHHQIINVAAEKKELGVKLVVFKMIDIGASNVMINMIY